MKLGLGCFQIVKVMGLLLFRKTADRLITYRKLTRTPKEYWGPKNTTPFLNLGPSRGTLPHPDTRLRKSPEPCLLAPEGLSVHGVLSIKLIWEAARIGMAFLSEGLPFMELCLPYPAHLHNQL